MPRSGRSRTSDPTTSSGKAGNHPDRINTQLAVGSYANPSYFWPLLRSKSEELRYRYPIYSFLLAAPNQAIDVTIILSLVRDMPE